MYFKYLKSLNNEEIEDNDKQMKINGKDKDNDKEKD